MSLVVDIRKTLGAFTVDARFETGPGVTALFGRSGAGKTSIVQMLAGLIRPDGGRIALDGTPLFDAATRRDVPPDRRRIGYVFQDARLFPHLSVRRNLEYGRRRLPAGETRKLPFDQVVGILGIGALLDRRPASLSGGERQRVAIGRALLAAPRLLLMDEPLASLDADRKAEIMPFIDRVRREFRIPIVYVSHAVDEILQLADTMVLVADGAVAAVGPVEDVLNRFDLARAIGDGDAGSVVPVTVASWDPVYGIAELRFAGGVFRVTSAELRTGERLRIRIRARDVSLALEHPQAVSVLNVFEGRVAVVGAADQPQVDVAVDVGGVMIWSRVTRKSLEDLGVAPGRQVYAMVKAVAIDRPAGAATPHPPVSP